MSTPFNKTLVLIKPDATKRKIIGLILSIFESSGLRVVKAKLVRPTRDLAERHYEEHKNKDFFAPLIEYTCSGDVMAFILEGEDAVTVARSRVLDYIRPTHAIDKRQNSCHASDSEDAAKREMVIWFGEEKKGEGFFEK